MFDLNIVLVGVLAVLVVILLLATNGRKDAGTRLPPSIPALPLLGSIPFFTGSLETMQIFFMRKAEQLGPVLRLYFARRMAVSLNGKDAIAEAMLKNADAFGDKPGFWTEAIILNPDLRGISFARYNKTFKDYHKLTLAVLKEFRFGINHEMDFRISQQIEGLITEIRKQNGVTFDPKSLLKYATSNVVMTILFGGDSKDGIDRSKLIDDSYEFISNLESRIDYAPFIRFLPSIRKKIENVTGAHERLVEKIEISIEHNKRNPSERNFVSRFLEIEGPNYNHLDLVFILRDMAMASADTVMVIMTWALLELANHPKVRSCLQREIDEVCDGNRLPSIDDKPRLPYTEAVMFEVMRRHTLVYNPIPRLATKDTEICGYAVPRGCMAIYNMYGAHMDPKVWGDPENFRPERFLDKDNKVIRRDDIIPFGLGKRSCIGEVLARQEFFLFLVFIVKHFDIQPPEGQDSISVKEVHGLVVKPSPFELRLIPRC